MQEEWCGDILPAASWGGCSVPQATGRWMGCGLAGVVASYRSVCCVDSPCIARTMLSPQHLTWCTQGWAWCRTGMVGRQGALSGGI
jgi:hypothetical protein